MSLVVSLFLFFFSSPKRHFFVEEANDMKTQRKTKKKKNCCSVFVVVFCGEKRKVSCHVWSEDARAEETDEGREDAFCGM